MPSPAGLYTNSALEGLPITQKRFCNYAVRPAREKNATASLFSLIKVILSPGYHVPGCMNDSTWHKVSGIVMEPYSLPHASKMTNKYVILKRLSELMCQIY